MADYTFAGPLCLERRPWSLADGTLQTALCAPPGTLGLQFSLYPRLPAQPAARPAPAPDVGFLFQMCLNPKQGLSDADYKTAATDLGVEIAAIKAVAAVESPRAAFDELGRPSILFERHYFHRLTSAKYADKHPTVSQKKRGEYGKFSIQYTKLEEAYGLDKTAALSSASWGRFQIMGSNHRAAGFDSVQAFVKAMSESEAAHLRAFVAYVSAHPKMKKALQDHDWATFAKGYNGSDYAVNKYDTKLAEKYKQLSPAPADGAAAAKPAGPGKLKPGSLP